MPDDVPRKNTGMVDWFGPGISIPGLRRRRGGET